MAEVTQRDHQHHHHHHHRSGPTESTEMDRGLDPASSVRVDLEASKRSQLPKGWLEHFDPNTKYPYYENIKTKEVQWEMPTEDVEGITDWEILKLQAARKRDQLREQMEAKMKKTRELLGPGRFGEWTRTEMILLLINSGVQVRNEESITVVRLRDLCEEQFSQVVELPPKPVSTITSENFWRISRVVVKLQLGFFKRRLERETQKAIELSLEDKVATNQFEDYLFDMQVAEVGEGAGAIGADDSINTPPARQLKSKEDEKKFIDYLDKPWEPPSWEKARIYENYYKPRRFGKGEANPKFDFCNTTTGRHCFHSCLGEQCDFWHEGAVSEFGIFGAAITNYFKFVKLLFWLFAVLSLVGLPDLVLNIVGPRTLGSDGRLTGGLADLAVTTIGNLAPNEVLSADSTLYIRVPGCYEGGYYEFNCNMTKERVGLFYAWLDVIVVVILLATFVWQSYFESKEEADLNKFTVTSSMFTVMVNNLPEDATDVEVKEAIKSTMKHRGFPAPKIQTIFLGYDDEREIHKATKRGMLLREKVELTEHHRYECTKIREDLKYTHDSKDEKVAKLRKDFLVQVGKLSEKIRYEDLFFTRVSEIKQTSLCAFVTFNTISDAINCVKAYGMTSLWQKLCGCVPGEVLLRKKILRVERAPEPSTIIWENLRYKQAERFARRFLTTMATLLLVVLSVLICFGAKVLQEQVRSEGGSALCPTSFSSLSTADKKTFVTADGNSKYLHCFCSNLPYTERATDSTCRNYYASVGKAEAITVFAAIVVVLVNSLMEIAIQKLVSYEKHHSEDTMNRSVFQRLFVLKYINTCGVFLILNNYHILNDVLGITNNNSVDFNSDWYQTVGVTVLVVQMLNIVTSQSWKLFQAWYHNNRLVAAKKDPSLALTQAKLNSLHLGPKFEHATNYATLMSTTFTCLTFATGMPLLYIVAAANFFVTYFVEKYMFIFVQRTPPRLDGRMGKEAVRIIPWAVVLHLGTSIWMLGNKELFLSEGTSLSVLVKTQTSNIGITYMSEKLQMQHTFILMVLWCIVTFGIIIFTVFTLCQGRHKEFDVAPNSIVHHTNYEKACQRLLIKGDTSYNILLNPKYKEHFGLSWGFAMRHSHVRSIRFDTAQQRALQQELEGDGSGGPRGADMERADVVEQRLRRMTQQSMLAASSDSADGSGNSPMGYVRR